MKHLLLALITATLVAGGAPGARAARVSVEFFYDALEPHGEWIEAADYGYVWHPRDVDAEWRPYTVGTWAYTDAGWTWISDEPFGWATYHYGRWVEIDRTGWVWVPGNTWGPAWVSWRRSETHVGWAPLPPEARFETRVGFRGWVDSYYDIGPTYYSFVRVRDLGAPRLRTVILPPRENITIIQQTTNITNITYANNVVINQGPDYDVVVRQSAQPIRRLKLERRTEIDADVRNAGLKAEVSEQSLRVVAPKLEAATASAAKPKKVARKLDRLAVNRGWRDAGDAAQVQELRRKVAAEAKVPEGLPPKPKLVGADTDPASRATTDDKSAATTEKPDRPRAEPADTKTPADAEKPAATAQQPGRERGDAAATSADRGARTPAREAADQSREARPDMTKPPGQDAPTATATNPSNRPEQENPRAERPDRERPQANRPERNQPRARQETEAESGAAARERNERERPQARPDRPEQAPPNRREEPARTRPGAERPERKAPPEAAERARPNADRPERNRPEAGRAERPAPQPDRPERRAPQRPPAEEVQRSPENRPPQANRPDRGPEAGRAKPAQDEKEKEKRD